MGRAAQRLRLTRIPREQRPASEGGHIWHAPRIVLARRGRRELWWLGSGSYYSDSMSGTQYAPTELVLAEMPEDRMAHLRMRTLCEGGRLTKVLLLHHADEIEKYLKRPGLVDLMNPNETAVLG
jgi:hypothetical protein